MAEEIKLWDKIKDTWSGNVDPQEEKYSIKEDLKKQEYPFYTKPKKKKKKDINNYDEFTKLIIETSERIAAPKKKPVKYTKEGLTDVALMLTGNTTAISSTLDKWKTQRESKKFQKKRDYVEGYTDIAQQLLKGTGNFVQSASEWVLTPIDWAFSTEFQQKFNKSIDEDMSFAADKPESIPGSIAKLIGEYAIPVSVATKIKSGLLGWSKLKWLQERNKVSKASKIATRMAEGAFILGFADAFYGSGGRPDMERGLPWGMLVGDPSKGRINKPIDTKGLTGSELAKATLINKIRFAREGAIIGGGFPLVGKAAQLTMKHFVRPGVRQNVGIILEGTGKTFSTAAWLLARTPGVPTAARITRDWTGAALTKAVVPALTRVFRFFKLLSIIWKKQSVPWYY